MNPADNTCPKCGYAMEPWDEECPRCAWQAKQPCQQCGRLGIVGECAVCRKDLCEGCAVREGGELRCPDCAAQAARPAVAEAVAPAAGAALPYPVRPTLGWWDGVVRAWAFVKASVGLMFTDKDLFLPSLFSVAVNAVIIGGSVLALRWTGLWQQVLEEKSSLALAATVAVLTLVLYLVTYFFSGMTVHLVDVAVRGRDAKLGRAFADCCKNFLGILSLAVVATVVAALTSAIRRRSRGRRFCFSPSSSWRTSR